MLSLIASVGSDRIGPASAIAVMVRTIGRAARAGRHPGRHHVTHAAAGRHPRAGEVHERCPVECAGPRLHLRLAVAGGVVDPARERWRCSSATPRSRWRRRRRPRKPTTLRDDSFTESPRSYCPQLRDQGSAIPTTICRGGSYVSRPWATIMFSSIMMSPSCHGIATVSASYAARSSSSASGSISSPSP